MEDVVDGFLPSTGLLVAAFWPFHVSPREQVELIVEQMEVRHRLFQQMDPAYDTAQARDCGGYVYAWGGQPSGAGDLRPWEELLPDGWNRDQRSLPLAVVADAPDYLPFGFRWAIVTLAQRLWGVQFLASSRRADGSPALADPPMGALAEDLLFSVEQFYLNRHSPEVVDGAVLDLTILRMNNFLIGRELYHCLKFWATMWRPMAGTPYDALVADCNIVLMRAYAMFFGYLPDDFDLFAPIYTDSACDSTTYLLRIVGVAAQPMASLSHDGDAEDDPAGPDELGEPGDLGDFSPPAADEATSAPPRARINRRDAREAVFTEYRSELVRQLLQLRASRLNDQPCSCGQRALVDCPECDKRMCTACDHAAHRLKPLHMRTALATGQQLATLETVELGDGDVRN